MKTLHLARVMILGVALAALGVMLSPIASAQDISLRYSLKAQDMSMAVTSNVGPKIDGVLGQSWLAFQLVAGLGAVVEDGRPVGSFAALFELPERVSGKGLRLRAGPGFEGKKLADGAWQGVFDAVIDAAFRTGEGQTLSIAASPHGTWGVWYARRF